MSSFIVILYIALFLFIDLTKGQFLDDLPLGLQQLLDYKHITIHQTFFIYVSVSDQCSLTDGDKLGNYDVFTEGDKLILKDAKFFPSKEHYTIPTISYKNINKKKKKNDKSLTIKVTDKEYTASYTFIYRDNKSCYTIQLNFDSIEYANDVFKQLYIMNQ